MFFHHSLLYLFLTSLLSVIRSSWIDPDTHLDNYSILSYTTNKNYKLIFSDEFNVDNRNFNDGSDPRWTAINKNDYTNYALHYYHQDLVKTNNGHLNISTIVKDITFKVQDIKNGKIGYRSMTKNYQSAMIQGWNKFCFTGGIIEIRAKLPGNGNIGGFWPAIWLLGNLARATYVSSSNNVWPWSYDTCDKDLQEQQLFSACNTVNHYKLNSKQGRGAPEIDIFEVMPGLEQLINTPINKPYLSTSLQIAPAIQDYRPVDADVPVLEQWYNHGLEYGQNASLNIFFYGMFLKGIYKERSYLADAISANTNIDTSYFDEFHDYRVEWVPGDEGYIKWYIDGIFRYSIDASALNITGAKIPSEPMYLIFNNAISSTWGFPVPCPQGCPCDCFDVRREECQCAIPPRMSENFPAHFLIDYVRVYHDETDEKQIIGCSTKEYPTRRYIDAHPSVYTETDYGIYKLPLQPIAHGGARCSNIMPNNPSNDPSNDPIAIRNKGINKGDLECGYGYCNSHRKCVCNMGYTGSTCKAAEGYNDIDLDPDLDVVSLSKFFIPSSLFLLTTALFISYLIVVIYKYKHNNSIRGSWRLFARPTISFDSMANLLSPQHDNRGNRVSSFRSNRSNRSDSPDYAYEPVTELPSYGVDGISSVHVNMVKQSQKSTRTYQQS